jgi:hypothetical protein
LITGSSNKIRQQLLGTNLLIENIYGKNGDGLGIMYASDDGLVVTKGLPSAASGFREMVESLPDDDREVALHARWRTHGDIDLDNCHPYQVSDSTYMMHNGILSTGNAADESKSDTYHFIKDYLAGLPDDVLHKASFGEMLGDFIGNNKFAIMSADGRLTIVNKDQGLSHDGVWYSNTYAWSPSLLIPNYWTKGSRKKGNGVYYGSYGGYSDFTGRRHWLDDLEDDVGALMIGNAGAGAGGSAKKSAEVFEAAAEAQVRSDDELQVLYDNVEECLYQFDSSTLSTFFEKDTFKDAVKYIMDNYVVTEYSRFRAADYSIGYVAAVQAWCTGNEEALANIDPTIVAEALVQCCDFTYIEDAVDSDDQKPTAEAPVVEGAPSLTLVQ